MEFPRISGFFWHLYHSNLVAWCYNYDERATCIRTQKAKHEQDIRLRLFKQVKGSLPQEVIKAGQACDETWQAYVKAAQAYDEAGQACDETWHVYGKALQAYHEALRSCDEALRENMPAIKVLHDRECLNCPWDGKTIFPNAA